MKLTTLPVSCFIFFLSLLSELDSQSLSTTTLSPVSPSVRTHPSHHNQLHSNLSQPHQPLRMVNRGQSAANGAKVFERLPKTVVPSHYKISLEPDLINHTFKGEEIVKIDIKEETDKIVLNALDLDVTEAAYKPNVDGAQFVEPKNIELNPADEQIIISFPSSLKAGTSGELKLIFSGILNDKMKGFYRAKYPQGEGKTDKWAAVTQFEATDARRAFPCWDEPAIKATFEIKIIAPADQVALSNMPAVSEDVRVDGKKEIQFAPTPIMSTYLVAIVVGEFEYIESKTTDGNATVRVYAPHGKKEQGQFALEVATKALPYYSQYFKIDYPLPKMDLIAISDFAAGAMENWGLVTYRETCLLVDPNNTPAQRKEWVALVVAHELAHQWFGNLVTMEWWTHLWLNEGFATFIEHLCVDEIHPNYFIWKSFVTSTYARALALDALHNSHPIEVPVNNPSEIDEIFDDISYSKGASVIRMLYGYLGDDDFRKGMSLYLNRHKYQNTQTEDLWTALGEAASKPVREVMTTWTKQKGFPVVSVSQTIDGDNRIIKLSQEKFCADGKIPDVEKDRLWMIPLTFTSASSPDKVINSTLLSTKSTEIVLTGIKPTDWVKVNHESVGVYRVQYSSDMLEQLYPGIVSKVVPPLDRLSLQDDLTALVQAGKTSTVEILKLLESFKNEDEYAVWSSISECLGQINLILSFTDFQPIYHTWGRRLLNPLYQKVMWLFQNFSFVSISVSKLALFLATGCATDSLTFSILSLLVYQIGIKSLEGESHTDVLLRSLVLGRLAAFDEPSFIEEAQRLFDSHARGTGIIPADIRSAVYSAVARNGDEKTFNTFLRLFREADIHEEKNRLSSALGAFRDSSLLEKALSFAISDEVRSQDSVFAITAVAYNKLGREIAWKFFKDNAQLLKERYEGGFLLARTIKGVTQSFASEEKAQEVEAFFAKFPFKGVDRTVQQSLEHIRLNAEWLGRDSNDIKNYLTKAV